VKEFTFRGSSREASAQILRKEEARAVYDSIVAKTRDPALLEFIGYNLVRSSVFPIEANGTQTVRLVFEHLLPSAGNRVDYVLPRSEALDYNVPWTISMTMKFKRPIATVYSPSHRIELTRGSEYQMTARVAGNAGTEPGAFRLSCLLRNTDMSASMFAYPDPRVGGGYFLLLASLADRPPGDKNGETIKRDVILVLDHSGSMAGGKMEQVRKAALQVIAGLAEGEAFNIVSYNDQVDSFSPRPVIKNETTMARAEKYLAAITAHGGTNIYDALQEALRSQPESGMLPMILFLTDGLPTVGQTSEVAIREMVERAYVHHRRIFTFGVGTDVNTPLLERLATTTRGRPTFVLPQEDVEVKVAEVFAALKGPVLSDVVLKASDSISNILPAKIPDLFEGNQLVLLGQYKGKDPLAFTIKGKGLGRERLFKFTFNLDTATTKNGFVPRLWASRKIGVLIDAIRQSGAKGSMMGPGGPVNDPTIKELVDEVVRLSTEFGILTEYTAFLAREGTDLSNREQVLSEANTNFLSRAIRTRSGLGAVNQSSNSIFYQNQIMLNSRNIFLDRNMNRVAVANVQQVNDLAFYRRGNQWLDSRIVEKQNTLQPKRTLEFGSTEFSELAQRLAREGRQGTIALRGDIVMLVDEELVRIKGPGKRGNPSVF
jgi:Ca-activated chloride channel family protein